MEDSRKSLESESSSSSISESSSDEDQLPAKKLTPSGHDSDHSASSVCPSLSIASSEGATILRRSLRKIIEESKRDAASSSVSNSRESTPPRVSGSGRQISPRQVFSPGSSRRFSKNNIESLGTRSCRGVVSSETARVAKQLDFQRRYTRVRRVKRNVDYDATKSALSGSIVSSDDDASSVKESSKVCTSASELSTITDSRRLASRIDTSDTDSRASSLCTYSTRSGVVGQVSAAKLNSQGGASAKQKTGKRSRVFKCVADELAKLQPSDSETDGQTSALRTPFFDSFPDNSSNGSSICSSVPAAELSADRNADNCKNGVGSSSQGKDTSAVTPDPDEADLKKSAEFDTKEENWHRSEENAKPPPSAFKKNVSSEELEMQSNVVSEVTCIENENGDVDEAEDSVSNKMDETRLESAESALEDKVVRTKQEAEDNLKTDTEDMKVEECANDERHVTGQTEDEEERAGGCSKVVTGDGNEEQDTNEKFQEEVDDMSNVKEEPPDILGPDVEEFQLVADSVASLRNLVAKIAASLPPQDEAEPTSSQKNNHPGVDAELACELELHEHLSSLLAELEPYEQKLMQLNKKMKIKLRKEHENYVEEPPDKQQEEERWHSSESGDSDAEDAASSVGNSGSISQPSTPAPSAPDDAFIPGVRSLRRRLVINDSSRTVSSKSRKRMATESPESMAEKLPKTTGEILRSREGSGHQATTTPAAVSRLTSSSAHAGSKQRSIRPALPPTQRAVLRIAQPDGTVCFLAINNVSDISRLPVTAVVQQLLASQKQASANHRLSLGASATPRSAGLVPGFVGLAPRVTTTSTVAAHVLAPAAAETRPIISSSQSAASLSSSTSLHYPVLSMPPTSVSVGMLPSLQARGPMAQLPVLRPQNSNSLSAAFNRLRSQNALAQLFQSRGLNLRGIAAQSVNSQQLLNNIMAIRAAALSSTSPPTSSACHIVPVAADQPVAFAVPTAVTMPSKLPSTLSAASLSPQPSLSAFSNVGKPVTMVSSSIGQNLLLLNASSLKTKDILGSGVTLAPVISNQSNRTPLLLNVIASHGSSLPSTTCSSGAVLTSSSVQQIALGIPSTSTVSSVPHIPRIPTLRTPFGIRSSVTESTLAMAVRAAVAAGRATNVLSPLNRPQQPRYVNNLTVKTLLENRATSTAESLAPSSAETVMRSSFDVMSSAASSTESSGSAVKPLTMSFSAPARSNLPVQSAVCQTGTVRCTGVGVTSVPLTPQQLTGQPVLALLPTGVNIGTRIQQFVAVSATGMSVAKPSVAVISVAQLSLTSGVAGPSVLSQSVDVGALQAIIPRSKSRAPPSRPVRNNTRTTSVMKAPISALPRLTDLGLATSSTDQNSVTSGGVLTAAVSPVNIMATPSTTVAQNQAPSISTSPGSTSRTCATVSSVPLVGAGNKPMIMAAGSSSLVVPPSNNPAQVFLLQSTDGSLVQLVQLPAIAAVTQTKSASTRPNLLNQQVLLAPSPAVSGSPLHLFAVSSAPAANLSKMSASVPIVQFVMCSSAKTAVSSHGVNSATSPVNVLPVCTPTLSPVRVISQQAAVIQAPPFVVSPHRLPVTKQPSAFSSADESKPTTQQCSVPSRHSTELPKSHGLAEAADLFLMAASVVDRASAADEDVDGPSTTSYSTAVSSSSSLLTQTTR